MKANSLQLDHVTGKTIPWLRGPLSTYLSSDKLRSRFDKASSVFLGSLLLAVATSRQPSGISKEARKKPKAPRVDNRMGLYTAIEWK